MNYEIKSALEANIKEIFFDKNTNKLSYKNLNGIVTSIDSAESLVALQNDLNNVEAQILAGIPVVSDGVTITGTGLVGNPLVAAMPTGAWTVITLASDFEVNNLANEPVPTMTFNMIKDKMYLIEIDFVYSGNNTTGDTEFNISWGGNGYGSGILIGRNISNTVVLTAMQTYATNQTAQHPLGVDIADLVYYTSTAYMQHTFYATDGGTFQLNFGVNTLGSGRIAKLYTGTQLRYKVIN